MQEEQKLDIAKIQVDFPIDLNSLFTLNYSFDNLKLAIAYLAKN